MALRLCVLTSLTGWFVPDSSIMDCRISSCDVMSCHAASDRVQPCSIDHADLRKIDARLRNTTNDEHSAPGANCNARKPMKQAKNGIHAHESTHHLFDILSLFDLRSWRPSLETRALHPDQKGHSIRTQKAPFRHANNKRQPARVLSCRFGSNWPSSQPPPMRPVA